MATNDNRNKDRSKVRRGRHYEQIAANFYVARGFKVLEQNWQAGHKEIDLIVRRENLLIFVEVKSSNSGAFGHPAERVDQKKIANLSKAARRYVLDNNVTDTDLRFDVVTFVNGQLEHFPSAFEEDLGD